MVVRTEIATGQLSGLSPDQALQLLSAMLTEYCAIVGQPHLIPSDDFPRLSLSAMAHLKSSGRSNVVYGFVKCLGTMRPDGSDSLLPAKRMPFGLIQHCVNFFSSASLSHRRRKMFCVRGAKYLTNIINFYS